MRYDVSFYQTNVGQKAGDELLYPMTAKSDAEILVLAIEQAKKWNATRRRQANGCQLKYITIYRYVPQRCGWKTILQQYQIS